MKEFEKQAVRLLLEAAGLEALLDVLASASDEEFEYTGHGYFLTIGHPHLPAERRVLSSPLVIGQTGGVDMAGFLAFLENHEFMLECYGLEEGIPEDFRDRVVEIKVEE